MNRKKTVEGVHQNPDLSPEQVIEMREILKKFPDVFADIPGKTNLIECEIKVTSKEPVKVKQ